MSSVPPALTEKQKKRIARLGAEWAVLDSEENLISRLMGEQYEQFEEGAKKPRELVELERQQREVFKRKREISADLVAVERGGPQAMRRRAGRKPDFRVEARDRFIRRARGECPPKRFVRGWIWKLRSAIDRH